jgi:hypothetical protein
MSAAHLAIGRQWVQANQNTADQLGAASYPTPVLIAFGFGARLINSNSVNTARAFNGETQLPIAGIPTDAVGVADPKRTYRNWLESGSAATACILVSASGTGTLYNPPLDDGAMTEAAKATGFTPVTSWPMPNGRVITEWRRSSTCPVS